MKRVFFLSVLSFLTDTVLHFVFRFIPSGKKALSFNHLAFIKQMTEEQSEFSQMRCNISNTSYLSRLHDGNTNQNDHEFSPFFIALLHLSQAQPRAALAGAAPWEGRAPQPVSLAASGGRSCLRAAAAARMRPCMLRASWATGSSRADGLVDVLCSRL